MTTADKHPKFSRPEGCTCPKDFTDANKDIIEHVGSLVASMGTEAILTGGSLPISIGYGIASIVSTAMAYPEWGMAIAKSASLCTICEEEHAQMLIGALPVSVIAECPDGS